MNIADKNTKPVIVLEGGSTCVVLCHPRVVVPGKMKVSVVSFPCLVSSQISIFQILQDKRRICVFLVLVSEYWDRWGPASPLHIPWLFSRGGSRCVALCHPRAVGPGKMHVSVVSFPCLVSRF